MAVSYNIAPQNEQLFDTQMKGIYVCISIVGGWESNALDFWVNILFMT